MTTFLLLLGGSFTLVFVGYLSLSLFEGDRAHRMARPKKFTGFCSILTGLIALTAWSYFMGTGMEGLTKDVWSLVPHVVSQFICASGLILSGIALLRNWSTGPTLFMISMAITVLTALLALAAYVPMKHPVLMNGVLIILLVVGVNLVGLVYAWEHFVLHMDEEDPDKKKEF